MSSPQLDDLTVDEDILDAYDGPIPRHVAVIMDGNGRWATCQGKRRIQGHRAGADAVRCTVESCRYLEVDCLTLYAFSSQNWDRPRPEVSGLMTLFSRYIKKERRRLINNGIRLQVIGRRQKLSNKLQRAVAELEEASAHNTGMTLQVAVSYGGRDEIVRAARQIATAAKQGHLDPQSVDADTVKNHLYTGDQPDPELVIRTSGEQRVSNFLLWQIAYSELYFTDTLWPDFREPHLLQAFQDFGRRQRRFGKTGQQIS